MIGERVTPLYTLLLLAQGEVVVGNLGGAAGWAGAGLLGAVLAWLLMIHIPAKDKQLKELLDNKDEQIKEFIVSKDTLLNSILERKWQMIEKMNLEYKQALKEVMEHCEKELLLVMERTQSDLSQLTNAIQELSQHVMTPRRGPKIPPAPGSGG